MYSVWLFGVVYEHVCVCLDKCKMLVIQEVFCNSYDPSIIIVSISWNISLTGGICLL